MPKRKLQEYEILNNTLNKRFCISSETEIKNSLGEAQEKNHQLIEERGLNIEEQEQFEISLMVDNLLDLEEEYSQSV